MAGSGASTGGGVMSARDILQAAAGNAGGGEYIVPTRAFTVGSLSSSLAEFDITNPANITLSGSIIDATAMPAPVYGVYVHRASNVAYTQTAVSNTEVTVSSIDVSTPSNMAVLDTISVTGSLVCYAAIAMDETNYILFLGDYSRDAVFAIDVSNPSAMFIAGSISNKTALNAASGLSYDAIRQVLYVSGSPILTVLDVSDPANMTIVGSCVLTYSGSQGSCEYDNERQLVYVTGDTTDSFSIVDVSAPTAPILLAGIQDATNLNAAGGVAYDATTKTCYVASRYDRLTAIDVTNPSIPSIISSYVSSAYIDGAYRVKLDTQNKIAYVTSILGDHIAAIDISDPAAMTPISASPNDAVNTDGPRGLFLL